MIFQDGDVKVAFKNNCWNAYYKNDLKMEIKENDWAEESVPFKSKEAAMIVVEGFNDFVKEGVFKTAADPMGMADPTPPPMGAATPQMGGVDAAPPPMPTPDAGGLNLGGAPGMDAPMPDMAPSSPGVAAPLSDEQPTVYVPHAIPLAASIAGMSTRLKSMKDVLDQIQASGGLQENHVKDGDNIMQAIEEDFITVAESFKDDLSDLYKKIVDQWKAMKGSQMTEKFEQSVNNKVDTAVQEAEPGATDKASAPDLNAAPSEPSQSVPVYHIGPQANKGKKNDSIKKEAGFSISRNNYTAEFKPTSGVSVYKDAKEIKFWDISGMNQYYRKHLTAGNDEILAEFLDEAMENGSNGISMGFSDGMSKTYNKKGKYFDIFHKALSSPWEGESEQDSQNYSSSRDAGSTPGNGSPIGDQTTARSEDASFGKELTVEKKKKKNQNVKQDKTFDKELKKEVKKEEPKQEVNNGNKDNAEVKPVDNPQEEVEKLKEIEEKRQQGVSVEEIKQDKTLQPTANAIVRKIVANQVDSIIDELISGIRGKKSQPSEKDVATIVSEEFERITHNQGIDYGSECDCSASMKNKKEMLKKKAHVTTIMSFSKKELGIEADSHYGKSFHTDNDHEFQRILKRKIAQKLKKFDSPDFTIIEVKEKGKQIEAEICVFDNIKAQLIKPKAYRNRPIDDDIGSKGYVFCPINGGLMTKLCSVCALAGNPDTYIKDGFVECHADDLPEYLKNKGY